MSLSPVAAAEFVLDEIWGNRGFPIDPVKIATALGLDVQVIDFPPEVSGALYKKPGQDPIIYLNQGDSPNRKRFTCAHELGHYIYRLDKPEADDYEYIDMRDKRASTGTEAEEVFANQFAANLLMPEAEVRHLHEDGEPYVVMAYHFRVSDDAMRFRLKNLGILDIAA